MRVRIITTVIPGVWNKPRVMVATLVSETEVEYVLSFRPLAGTSDIAKKHVAQLWETDDPIALPRIYRGETRLA